MDNRRRVFVAGSRGLVGSALVRRLEGDAPEHPQPRAPSSDLMDRAAVAASTPRPARLRVRAAARVAASTPTTPTRGLHPENLQLPDQPDRRPAYRHGVTSSFPRLDLHLSKLAPQRMPEVRCSPGRSRNQLGYASPSIAGIEMLDAISRQHGFPRHLADCRPTSTARAKLQHLQTSHVMPA